MLVLKRIGFYFLSFTWGGIMSLVGLLTIGVLALLGRVHTYHGRLYGTVGRGWGGLELGCFFICGEKCQSEYLMAHESGHGLQNIMFGPLFIFIIFIPSCIRYWYRELKYERKGIMPPTSYDSIGFEGWATNLGEKYVATDRI